MNLGLGNLRELKEFILLQGLWNQDDYDVQLARIGRGVALRFEQQCNRFFDRIAGAEDSFSADREHWYLSRFPAEVISSVESKSTDKEGWITLADSVLLSDLKRGLVRFGVIVGDYATLIRVTYTGGFWFEALEPSEEGYPSTMPEGAFAVPADLKLAWFLQCQHVWEGKDHTLPKGLAADGTPIPFNLTDVKLLPEVAATLQGYIRYQIV